MGSQGSVAMSYSTQIPMQKNFYSEKSVGGSLALNVCPIRDGIFNITLPFLVA